MIDSLLSVNCLIHLCNLKMPTARHSITLRSYVLLFTIIATAHCGINLALTNKHGKTLNSADCNPQTTIDFEFSSLTTAASATTVVKHVLLRPTLLALFWISWMYTVTILNTNSILISLEATLPLQVSSLATQPPALLLKPSMPWNSLLGQMHCIWWFLWLQLCRLMLLTVKLLWT